MTTAVDTNVVIALWDKDPALSLAAHPALEAAFRRVGLVVAAPVLAELLAAPGRSCEAGAALSSAQRITREPGGA